MGAMGKKGLRASRRRLGGRIGEHISRHGVCHDSRNKVAHYVRTKSSSSSGARDVNCWHGERGSGHKTREDAGQQGRFIRADHTLVWRETSLELLEAMRFLSFVGRQCGLATCIPRRRNEQILFRVNLFLLLLFLRGLLYFYNESPWE